MQHREARRIARLGLLAGILAISAGAQVLADPDGVIRVEVSQMAPTFVFDESPVFDDGGPAYGNVFVVQGVLYPAGTVTSSGNKGMNPDGTPEFPDKVIGEWTCWGRFIGNGARTSEGAFVMSTQVFSFGEGPEYGPKTIVTTGYEAVDAPVQRAITGGTGEFSRAAGTQRQAIMAGGRNASGGLNLTQEIVVDDAVSSSLAQIQSLLNRMAVRLGLVP